MEPRMQFYVPPWDPFAAIFAAKTPEQQVDELQGDAYRLEQEAERIEAVAAEQKGGG